MGEVIASKAAADDIFADIETTLARAVARGGKWKGIGESRLASMRGVIAALKSRLSAADAEFLPVKATIEAQDKRSDQLIGQISDEIWNAIGRPAFDPTFDVVFPGGIAHYTQGANEDQPERMELLAELLEMKLLSKVRISPIVNNHFAASGSRVSVHRERSEATLAGRRVSWSWGPPAFG